VARHLLLKPLLGTGHRRNTPPPETEANDQAAHRKTKLDEELDFWDMSAVDEYWAKLQRNWRIINGGGK